MTSNPKTDPRRSVCLTKKVPPAVVTAPAPSSGLSASASKAQTAREKLRCIENDNIAFRLLNALLTHAPTAEGVDVIATDIIDASAEPNGLEQLAEFYKTGLLLPMKAAGRTPQVSFHPSRDPEIEVEADRIAADLEAAKRDPAALKKYTLYRDGFRCVITRNWDFSSLSIPDVKDTFDPATDASITTQAAHVLPFSLMGVDTNKKLFEKTSIGAVIKSFTNIEFNELNDENITSLANVITLSTTLHTFFRQLHLWFEAVPNMPHTYKIRKASAHILRGIVEDGTEVTFASPNPETLPLPDPRYVAFHAALAKVIHMAGIAEHLDDIIRCNESIRVLSNEPDAEYLDGLLRMAQRCNVTD